MELGREADNDHSLARLEPMNQVGGKADTCGGLSTDSALCLNIKQKINLLKIKDLCHK